MPRIPKLTPVQLARGDWKVEVPAALTAEGKRVRRFFADKTKAEKFAAALRGKYTTGERRALITPELAWQAAEAARLLNGTGITLVEAARIAAEMLGEDGAREPFIERYKRAMIDGEIRWSKRYANDMSALPRWVGDALMRTPCGQLKRPVVERMLRSHAEAQGTTLALATLTARMRYVSAVLGHKVAHRRGGAAAAKVLAPAQAARLLRACQSAAERRMVALLVWAGIRPDVRHGEIMQLDWSHVGENEIYVPPEAAKTNTDRHIPITPRLRRLLRGHPASGPVAPPNWRRIWPRLRKAAGIAGREWGDVCRHTFGSNFLAAYGEDSAKQAMGHTAGSRTLFQHYRRAVTAAAGRRFFAER